MRILVVEDDPVIARALMKGFTEAGHRCDLAPDGERGAESARTQQADAIVLDLMLPKRSGHEVLHDLRSHGVNCPVILLTALGAVDDRIKGINAVVRRSSHRPSPVLVVSDVTLNLTTRRVTHQGRDADLTPTEFSMMELLMRYSGQVVTRKMLCEHVWGFNWDGTTNVIEVHVNRLRGKINKGQSHSFITTVRGRGYTIAAGAAVDS